MGQSVDVVVSELNSAAARLEDAAQRLTNGLWSTDDETTQLLGSGWKGDAASTFGPAWEQWHGGAQQVVEGLRRISELLTIAGKEYATTDRSAANALGFTIQGASSEGSGEADGRGMGRGTVGQGDPNGASSAGGTSPGARPTGCGQEATSLASQLGQMLSQTLSQTGQAVTELAQQAAPLATAVTPQVGESESGGLATRRR